MDVVAPCKPGLGAGRRLAGASDRPAPMLSTDGGSSGTGSRIAGPETGNGPVAISAVFVSGASLDSDGATPVPI